MAAAEFSRLVQAQLDLFNYSFPAPPDDEDPGDPNDLHSQRWILLHSTIRSSVYTLKPHPKINNNSFGHTKFVKLNGKFSNPMTDANAPTTLPWIQIAPHFGHLVGPVERFSTPAAPLFGLHSCVGLRILSSLPKSRKSTRDEPLDVYCYDGLCPVNENINPILATLLGPSSDPAPRPTTPPANTSLIRQRSPRSQPFEVEEWYNDVSELIRPVTTGLPFASLHTKTIEAGGECLLDLIIHIVMRNTRTAPFIMQNRDLQQAEVLRCDSEISFELFLKDYRVISVGVRGTGRSSITHGAGPERAIIRHAATVLSQRHHYWQQAPSSEMFRPVFTPGAIPIPERIRTFRVHGMFLALPCLLLQHGLSIWLLLCLIRGKEALLIPQNVLLHMDPGAHNILAPWYQFHQDTPVPPATDPSHPLRMFIIDRMDRQIQPNLISNTCTKEEHEGWVISAFATVLLGHDTPWALPEYIGLADGFNFGVGTVHFAQRLRSIQASAFLVSIYDRRVKTVDAVATHLGSQIASRSPDNTSPYFVKLFMLRVHNYIYGVGHPPEMRRQLPVLGISDAEFLASRGDPLLCANLILKCGSDSDMTPVADRWRILFNFIGKNTRTSVIGAPLGFHTCFYTIDVFLDSALRELLLQPVLNEGRRTSDFDLWLHEQLVNPTHNTGINGKRAAVGVTLRRSAGAPRRADEPVSYALAVPEEENRVEPPPIGPITEEVFDSGSDTSSLHPFSHPTRPLALPQSRGNSVEILDSPPAVWNPLPDDQETGTRPTSPDPPPIDAGVLRAELAFMQQIDVHLIEHVPEDLRSEGGRKFIGQGFPQISRKPLES
ncbi:hypothetical protein C8F04DRAFT_1183352 [Mycena alexandri]|uniref:Uncharacterized protein n=1 Tax=Mycena alexandri TaxID=1745969 RepID=A0AAD6X6T9_9AGAR|nr:hypothetical protein C8F04DRAFT_1183352 [Mycena alexandri]